MKQIRFFTLFFILLTFASCSENARIVTFKKQIEERFRNAFPKRTTSETNKDYIGLEPRKPNIDAAFIQPIDLPVASIEPWNASKAERLNNRNITARIEKMLGETMQYWTEQAGVNYPPQCVVFRNFKLEGEFEIWGGNTDKNLKLIKTFEVCAADFSPGPKLQQGDYKTPEGFYELRTLIDSKLRWMWIDLDDETLFDVGQVGVGSSYKLFLPYPNNYDRKRTRENLGSSVSTGGEICIHGNCASAGCISFQNNLYSAVYLFAQHQNRQRYGNPTIHTFPFRFTEALKKDFADDAENMNEKNTLDFWNNLEKGYKLFNENPKQLKWSVNQNGYKFR